MCFSFSIILIHTKFLLHLPSAILIPHVFIALLSEFCASTESCFFFSAYETLSDESRRREYDQFGGASYFTEENQSTQRQSDHQSFNLNDIFKDFGIFSQNRHARQHRAFHQHSRSNSRRKRHSEGGFGPDDLEDLERMFTFDGHTKQTEDRFHGPSRQHCQTVTQRRGNMVTTYTDCTVS